MHPLQTPPVPGTEELTPKPAPPAEIPLDPIEVNLLRRVYQDRDRIQAEINEVLRVVGARRGFLDGHIHYDRTRPNIVTFTPATKGGNNGSR